jgi:hypothetical protein
VADRQPPTDIGACRIDNHPILAPLPAADLVELRVDGVAVMAREGEPLAAALLAAGHRVFRTMPRFGDPRGGYCIIGRCADCFMVVDGLPNVRACLKPVRAGMDVRVQHGLGEQDLAGNPRLPTAGETPA